MADRCVLPFPLVLAKPLIERRLVLLQSSRRCAHEKHVESRNLPRIANRVVDTRQEPRRVIHRQVTGMDAVDDRVAQPPQPVAEQASQTPRDDDQEAQRGGDPRRDGKEEQDHACTVHLPISSVCPGRFSYCSKRFRRRMSSFFCPFILTSMAAAAPPRISEKLIAAVMATVTLVERPARLSTIGRAASMGTHVMAIDKTTPAATAMYR